jgi:hypothetical protein
MVHTLTRRYVEEFPLSLKDYIFRYFEGKFDLPATKETNMALYTTLKCLQNHRGVFGIRNRETCRLSRNIRISHDFPSFPPSLKQFSNPNQPLLNDPRIVTKISVYVASLKASILSTVSCPAISSRTRLSCYVKETQLLLSIKS